MAGDPVQFRNDHPQRHCFLRNFHPDQLLDGEAVPKVHVHRREVIHAVGVGNPLGRREVFADLFRTAVQVSDMRRHFVDNFAVGAQQKSQHTVSTRVLRSHVDEHFVGADVKFDDARVFECQAHVFSFF